MRANCQQNILNAEYAFARNLIPLSVLTDLQKHHECTAPAFVARGGCELRDHSSSFFSQPRCDGPLQYRTYSRIDPFAGDDKDRPLPFAVCSRDKLFEAFKCLFFHISVEIELVRQGDRSPFQLPYPAACRPTPRFVSIGLRQFIAECRADPPYGSKKKLLFVPFSTLSFFGGYAIYLLRLNLVRRVNHSRPVNRTHKQGGIVVDLFFS